MFGLTATTVTNTYGIRNANRKAVSKFLSGDGEVPSVAIWVGQYVLHGVYVERILFSTDKLNRRMIFVPMKIDDEVNKLIIFPSKWKIRNCKKTVKEMQEVLSSSKVEFEKELYGNQKKELINKIAEIVAKTAIS